MEEVFKAIDLPVEYTVSVLVPVKVMTSVTEVVLPYGADEKTGAVNESLLLVVIEAVREEYPEDGAVGSVHEEALELSGEDKVLE